MCVVKGMLERNYLNTPACFRFETSLVPKAIRSILSTTSSNDLFSVSYKLVNVYKDRPGVISLCSYISIASPRRYLCAFRMSLSIVLGDDGFNVHFEC